MQQPRGIKGFFASRVGLAVLGAIAVGAMVGSFLYLGPFIAVPTLLLFGLAIPIYSGRKRPRTLAVFGIAVLVIAAPIASAADAAIFRMPSPSAASSDAAPYGQGGPVLDQALASPTSGPAGGTFQFSVLVQPAYVPTNASAPLWVEVFVSTCPGATGSSSPNCGSGYPFVVANRTLPANLTQPTLVTFNVTLNGTNIWWWQMATAVESPRGSSNLTWIFLSVPNGYGAVEGPVTGDYLSTLGLLVAPITEVMFLYSGSVFLFALLVYMFLKAREARRRASSMPPGAAPTNAPAPDAGGAGAGAPTKSSAPPERACPNCGAVVYPSEKACWKCGAALPRSADAPLASS